MQHGLFTRMPASAVDVELIGLQTKCSYSCTHVIVYNTKRCKAVPRETNEYFGGALKERHRTVEDLYIAAAQMAPEQLDADVQIGLGVLFNISREYDKV